MPQGPEGTKKHQAITSLREIKTSLCEMPLAPDTEGHCVLAPLRHGGKLQKNAKPSLQTLLNFYPFLATF